MDGPFHFQPPAALALPNFKGCIELDTLNEEVLSLYNFENIFSLNTTEEKPCGRSVYCTVNIPFIIYIQSKSFLKEISPFCFHSVNDNG